MSFSKLTIRDVPLDNSTVLVRADYQVPLDDLGIVGDDSLIQASLPTINHLLDRGCKIVIISHADNPNGIDKGPSLESVGYRLANLLQRDIRFADVTVGDKVFQIVKRAPKNSVIMLENLHFHPDEQLNNVEFAKKIVKNTGAKYFVQDNPNIVHEYHACSDAITMLIPSVAGFLLEKSNLDSDELPGIYGLLDYRP